MLSPASPPVKPGTSGSKKMRWAEGATSSAPSWRCSERSQLSLHPGWGKEQGCVSVDGEAHSELCSRVSALTAGVPVHASTCLASHDNTHQPAPRPAHSKLAPAHCSRLRARDRRRERSSTGPPSQSMVG